MRKTVLIKLIRVEYLGFITFGTLLIEGKVFCVTLEQPDRDNQRNISCVPCGSYTCKRVDSPKYGNTFEVMNVPNRSHILFHSGNLVRHTKGCILLARKFGTIEKHRAILDSRSTVKEFLGMLEGVEEFEFEIVEA